jgi:hypothetical protein
MLIDFQQFFDEGEEFVPVESLSTDGSVKARVGPKRDVTGRASLVALVFIRFMFISGRKSITLPFSSLYAFIPSKSVWA